jgi:hypothetical protein
MRRLLLVIVTASSFACGDSLNRTTAATILSRQSWPDQPVALTDEQAKCAVDANLLKYQPPKRSSWESIAALYSPTVEGEKLGLTETLIDAGSGTHLTTRLRPGFMVVATVTGIAETNGAAGRQVEASLGAKVDHACFAAGLPFAVEADFSRRRRGNLVGPQAFVFVRFDNGWRVQR